ncbi:MAG TPA: alpha/beta fold hydrolase [Steroidobacteraceae bacterium]|nr:alpha/beta fold hydrolase [Steroidobacteraceae bacterium]
MSAAVLCVTCAAANSQQTPAPTDDAARFGQLEMIYTAALSADGKNMVFVGPGTGPSTIAVIVDLAKVEAKQIARGDGDPMKLTYCDWSAKDRLVCQMRGNRRVNTVLVPVTRTLALNSDGSKVLPLGQRDSMTQRGVRLFDAGVVDWLDGVDGKVLMSRSNVPEVTTGSITARTEEGLGVDLVDTRSGKATAVEKPGPMVDEYISDGLGHVRLMTMVTVTDNGSLKDVFTVYYRAVNDRAWHKLGIYHAGDRSYADDVVPVAVDPIINAAYVLQPLNGRMALFRIALDGSMKKELVFASKQVDVDDVVRVGRGGRVIGATYVTERRQVEYFDPAYRSIAASLAQAMPKLPIIEFVSASADEQVLLVWAGSDVDAGHFYVFDRTKKTLLETMVSRPEMKGVTLSPVKAITYTAADGTQIPAYLTLPPGVTDAKNLPAIVMPHGGPAARDEWGFDWLSQFYAHRGYAVLQPNFRGSAGYGDKWYMDNGFKSWKTAIGDVCDAGRWLVAQGMADASKLAIVGWSYGGYAALQANVLDPTLFKAVVAVAPVTDLALLKTEAAVYTNGNLVADFVGSGPHVAEGSPAQHADVFKAPVLMFQGDNDLNVDIAQSRKMDKELRSAGKSTELVVYPKLEHSLMDSAARADLLRKSDAFLRQHLKL